jgi:uncharacterized cupin superfamily protein
VNVANLHEGPSREVAAGHIRGLWRDLGRQAGSRAIGLRRMQIPEGGFSTPAHEHSREEEIFHVLEGEGLLWQDGATVAVAAGDTIVHGPKTGAHTLRAGSGGLDLLVFGQRLDLGLTTLPRARIAWSLPHWLELGDGEPPFAREAALGPPECPDPGPERPAHVVSMADVEATLGGRVRALGAAAGARATGLNHVVLAPAQQGAPAHCHSHEEELFVVLQGAGALELFARGEKDPTEISLRAGSVFSRLPGSGVAHALRAGPDGLTYLAYGTKEPGDMCFYPQSGRVSLRGLGIALRAPEIDYL